MLFVSVLFVGFGGFIGAVFRYLISLAVPVNNIGFPIATLLVNVAGAFAIGLISGIFVNKEGVNANVVLFLTMGVCGGFTTFSSFSLEVFMHMEAEKYALGICYAVVSLLFCLIGVVLGRVVAKSCLAT
jgi:CrcB protein